MSTELQVISQAQDYQLADGDTPVVGIVVSDWNPQITGTLRAAAVEQLKHVGLSEEDIKILEVPGSWELPFGVKKIQMLHSDLTAIIAIGSVIKGDTRHDEYINSAVTSALMQISLVGNTPVILGLLTTEDEQQARDRAGGSHGNKGYEWALSALKMSQLKSQSSKKRIGF